MKCYAVIDTNVLVSGLYTRNNQAPTAIVLDALLDGEITPLYHDEILEEYEDVLRREKFRFNDEDIREVIAAIRKYGMEVFPQPTGEVFVDVDDLIFYEVAMEKKDDGAYLVTGNQKHYPIRDFIVTPTEMVEILNKMKTEGGEP